ncbi:hypothetical protein MDA_GLEAN10012865 [Myotis davidii]|uniref:Uncharacterized protein n=1 Tax=Myotis davidii TaxID=225400 RepID=L5LAV4_MYODS|nr:hypothetical protein MDA_GLEAN10012865 [Myotis davidii]
MGALFPRTVRRQRKFAVRRPRPTLEDVSGLDWRGVLYTKQQEVEKPSGYRAGSRCSHPLTAPGASCRCEQGWHQQWVQAAAPVPSAGASRAIASSECERQLPAQIAPQEQGEVEKP